MSVKYNPFFYIVVSIFALSTSLLAQAPSSLVGKTITYNYQSPYESGTISFTFLEDNKGWIHEDNGEWEELTYQWTPAGDTAYLKIDFRDGDYLETDLTFRESVFVVHSDRGTSTFTYWDLEEPGDPPIEEPGTGSFTVATSTASPPLMSYFEDDFTNVADTRTKFGFGDGDTKDGLTVVQDTQSREYSIRGIYVDSDGDNSDDPDRWVELSAKTILPMNRSWVVEVELFTDGFEPSELDQIDYMRTAIELDGSLGNFHVGMSYNGYEFSHHAGIWNEVAWEYDSAQRPINSSATHTSYRLINDANEYELLFQVVETFDSDFGPYTIETTLIQLWWDEGWYLKNDQHYSEWRQLKSWESLGDRYVQPELAFELPHSWSDGHGSELTMYDLQGGEIGFRRFSVQGDPEIIEFDGDSDIPLFYNNLDDEVGRGGSNSRYHLLKGLHELAQLVESTEANSLKRFAVSLGVEDSILGFTLADTPMTGTFEFELDRDFQSGELADFAQYALIPRLESIDDHFSNVTETVTMATSMTGAEEEIIADATDVKVLRAMVNVLASLASLQSAYDWDYNAGDLLDLDMSLTETSLQEVRQKHPTLFGVRSLSQLAKSKEFLRSAISSYIEASAGLRTAGRYTTEQDWIDGTEPEFLFVLDQYDFADEQEFLDDLNELLDALDNDYVTTSGEFPGTVISLSAFFDGGLNLPVLLPSSIEDQFSTDELTDSTIGGILPNATYANSEFLQELREEFYEDELVYGQPVRHDSLKEALNEFDYLTYLDLNPDLGEWYQTEANAKQHFAERGFWDEDRYFYYPFENPSQNLVSEQLIGRKVSTSGTIADLDNLNFTVTYYFVDSIHAVVHYDSDSALMPAHWSKEKYFFKRLGRDSASFALINNDGDKLIADISFQNLGSGTTNLKFIENGGNVAWNQGTGNWVVSEFSLSEIPLDLQDEPILSDYAPYNFSEGAGYNQPRLENNDTFWPGYAESINFQAYGDQQYVSKSFSSDVAIPNDNGWFDNKYGNGQFDYFKTGPNSATLTLRFPDSYNWHADERRFVYNLQFTGENTGNYVKYSDYISQTDVTTGPFVLRSLSATSLYDWEDYDDFESGSLDSTKWETAYFSGGREPEVDNDWFAKNVVKLWGVSYSDSEPTKLPESATSPEWQNVLADSVGEGNSGILIFDDSIIGVQAKLLLEYSNAEQAGVFISAMFSGGGIELVKRGDWFYEDEWNSYYKNSPYFAYDVQDETGAVVEKKMEAYSGSWYEVAVIRKNNKSMVFVDGEKLSEVDSLIEPEAWIIGAFNDAGQPFSAYVDDVRVLRRSNSEFNADALVVDEISAQRDLVYLQTENGPELIDDAGEINFEIFLPQQPEFSAASLEVDGVSYDLTLDQGPSVFRTRYGYDRGEFNELYDIESSSDQDWSPYANGKSFNFTLTHNGNDFSYSHQLPAASELPSAPNLSINGEGNWMVDEGEGHPYLKLIPAQNVVVSWDPYQADDRYDHIFIGLTQWIGEDDEVDVFEHVLSSDSTSFEFSRDLLIPGSQYSLFVEFTNATEGYNPQGFRRAYQIDDEPILGTYASSITAIDMEIGSPLDGSAIFIDTNFDDAVIQPKLTASFENGLVTSTWENPDDGERVVKTESYAFEDLSPNLFQITLEEGDVLTFNTASGTGSLIDYDSSGVIDTSGSWDFTFRMYNWEDYDDFNDNSLDGEKWLSSTEFFQGNVPIETNQEIRLEGYTGSNPIDNSFLVFKDLDGIIGVEADIWLPENAPVETAVLLGIADGGTPLGSLDLWNNTGNAVMYIDLKNFETNEIITDSRIAAFGTKYSVALVKDGGKTKFLLDGEKVAEVTTTHSENINFLFRGESDAMDPAPYSVYLDNVRVLRGQEYIEPVTVVHDRLGNPLVNKVGLEYKWNSTLDGVTLWGVWEDSEDGWIGATVAYENGLQKASIGLTDELGSNLEVNHPYIIDENGMIKVTEDTALQYYQVTSVTNGVIKTADGSNFPLSDTSQWFTTRAAAEEFYEAKELASQWEQYDDFTGSIQISPSGGYAPESIVGYVVRGVINSSSGPEYSTHTFSDNRIVYQENGDFTFYDYERLSANQAKITYTFEDEANPMPEVVTLSFNSPTEGTFTWVEYMNSSMVFISDEATGSWSVVQSLDEEKWDVAQLDGGLVPVLDNGRLKFSGQPYSPNSVEVLTSAMLAIDPDFTHQDPANPQPHSILEFVESHNLKGIELTFSIPSINSGYMEFGLIGIDYRSYITAENDEQEQSALRLAIQKGENSENGKLMFGIRDDEDAVTEFYEDIQFDVPFTAAFFREETTIRFYLNDKLVGEYPYEDRGEHFMIRAHNYEIDQPFTTYLENVRVIRRSDDFKEVVVVDPNGKPVVIKQGDEYRWSDALDGVILWSVEWEPGESPDALTAKFENGKIIYGFDFVNDVTNAGSNSVDYSINQLGYISSLEGDGDYQYYNVVAVENGAISTIQGDQGLDSVSENGINIVDQWFFTTRAAAEEFYNSKSSDFKEVLVVDPNGKPVVIKQGDEYLWNDSLEGVTLWSVDLSGGDLQSITMRFENGRNFGNTGFYDQVVLPQPYNHEYIINSDGFIQVTEDNGYQYYHVIDVQDGVIATLEGDEQGVIDDGVSEADQWFFTTRAAAEEFYEAKELASQWEQYDDFTGSIQISPSGGYAPESIEGYVINSVTNFSSGSEYTTHTFSDNRIVHQENGDFTFYDYERLSANQAKITYTFEDEANPMPEVVTLTFNSPTEGTFTWVEYFNSSMVFKSDEATGSWSVVQSLDEEKWDVAQWDGGLVPVLDNGRVKFSGQPNSSESVEVATSAMLAIDSSLVLGDPTSQSPHSLLEFVESQNIKGIELTFSIPSNSPDLMGFGLFAVDYNYEPDGESEDAREKSIRFDIDLWNENGNNATVGFYVKDPVTNIESSEYRDIQFNTPYRVAFVREESFVRFYLEDEKIGEYPYQDRGEYFFVRAMNEVNASFTTYLENVRVIRRDDTEHFEEIFVSGGSMTYPHYTFNNSDGDELNMEEFVFQPDTKYRFIADGLNLNHPFTMGASINGSEIMKLFVKTTVPNLPEPEEHNFTGVSDDLEVLGNDLLMPPIEEDFGDDYVLSLNGDYFDFEYSNGLLLGFKENDLKLHYLCDIHSSMNGPLHLPIEEVTEDEKYAVFWVTPELFLDLTYIDWEWTSFAKFDDPQMGRGAYFAFEDTESLPPPYDPVQGDHEILKSYNLIHVTELIPEGEASIWMASPDFETYQTQVSPETLESEHNLTIVGYYTPQKREDLLAKVEEFLNNFKNGENGHLLEDWVNVVRAEKLNDAINPNRSIYLTELNNEITIYFDQDGDFVHSSSSWNDNWYRNDWIPTEIVNSVEAEFPGSEILELWDEVSVLEGTGFISRAIVESNSSDLFEIYLNNSGEKVQLVSRFFGVIERVFPEVAHQYMELKYRWDDDTPIYYWTWYDEYQEEFVASLDDGREVRFSKAGEFVSEFDPWKPPVNEDAGLAFNSDRSAWGNDLTINNFDGSSTGGTAPAFVKIEKLELVRDQNEESLDSYEDMPALWDGVWDDMAYRISLVNSQLGDDENVSLDDLELNSTVLPAGTPVKLSFTYESGEPRYLLVSGAKIRGYKHTMPEYWMNRPGSFTIVAETTRSITTTEGNLDSTFGVVVVMGGERWYNGAIFQANLPILDLHPSKNISPYDQVAAFSVSSDVSEDANVSAFLPRDLLEWKFGISEPHRVKAGIIEANGTLYFINGSGADEEGALFTGGGFTRILHEGYEPDIYIDAVVGTSMPSVNDDADEYKLGDHVSDAGLVASQPMEDPDQNVKKSRFDFNADGYADSLLEVRFFADKFPSEVGFGDPYVEPNLAGTVSGYILDESNNTIDDFGLWFFEAPDGLDGFWEPAFFEVDINHSSGHYTANLPEGNFYAEAWGYDNVNGVPYKPQTSESIFSISSGSNLDYNFSLEKEYVPDGGYGDITASLIVVEQEVGDHFDVSIELFPVDDLNQSLSEWSAAWLWVGPNGEISGSAPAGRFKVVLNSYDNSIRLNGGPIYWDIVADQLNNMGTLNASKSLPVRVSGMITDADTGDGTWAEVVFVDPNDEQRIFWPVWDNFNLGGDLNGSGNEENEVLFASGVYSVRIPAGSYKIKAVDWSGFYAEEYYQEGTAGTSDFTTASEVNVTNDLADINFTLSSGSVAEIRVNVTDDNTSTALPYAWFDFFDAYDEYAPITFPRVNYTDDGNYSLKISAGSYKLLIGSPDHRSLFLHTDVEGNYTWKEGDWSSAATLDVSSDQTVFLPNAELERWAIILPPPPPGDNSISGKVLSSKGVAVPKASIQCYTDDWMFWFEATSRSDGSFEFTNLPSGNWILEAHPPYDSAEFTGLQPALPNWENPIQLGVGETKDYNLILQGSNVSGRILYPKNDENDRVRLKPLPYAWLWAFEDENETGEPPVYEYGIYLDQPAFNEAYGNTDEDGFFSFSLKQAGKYSLRIEIPGELGSFSLDPIHFEVRDPNQELTLGNAIRLDWTKAEARATTYKVERKSSSSNSFTTVDNNISGNLKSFVDPTIVPGATYEYRVTAVSTSGSQVLSTDSYKVSKPFIYLAPPSKTIVGKVRNDLNASISGAEVQAWKVDGTGGWASAFTDVNGEYELNVGPGKWEVMVYKPWDRQVNWSYDKAPKQVNFADNGNKVEKKAIFTVTTLSGGISGVIDLPTDFSDYSSFIWIDAWNPDGVGNWTNPEANGSFSLSLSPGEYTFSIWLDPVVFTGYSSPEARVIKVGKSELDLGNIQLAQYTPTVLSGIIATADGTPLGNADVWAWSIEGGWAEDVTDSDGSYTLNVSPGTWEIGFNPPMPKDGSASPYLPAPPKRIKIGDSDKSLNFTVRKAEAKVNGVVYGTGGSPISDLYAWAYAREVTDGNSSDEFNEVVAEVEVSPRGEFTFPAVPGTYAVGLWLFSEEYLFPEEQILTLSEDNVLTDENDTVLEQITFTLAEVSSRVEGVLIDKETNQSIDGLIGEVYAMSLDGQGRQYTVIESNGSYSMLLAPGKWILEYYIEDDQGRNYPKESVSSVRINLDQGEAESANFSLSSASATISGAVVYDSNNSAVTESTLYVWAYREDSTAFSAYGNEVETDENGAFSISVLQGGKYEVGVTLSSDLRDNEYFEPTIQKVTMNTSSKSGIVFRLAKPEKNNYISGSVVDDLGNPLGGASVYSWTFDGAETSGLTDENGEFNMTVTSGSIWKVGAEYITYDESDSEIIYLIEDELNANLRVNEYVEGLQLVLNRPSFDVPDGKSITFDPSKDFITTLPDGTEITIPAGAVNVSSDVDSVRLIVTPTASGLDKSGSVKPANYVYSLELFDNKGKLIEGNFKKDVIIRMPIDVQVFRDKGLNADTIEGTFYSSTKKAWVKSKTSTWDKDSGILTMTTNHFSEKAASAESVDSPLANDDNSTSISGYDKWFESDWLGTFYDASQDSDSWYYHTDEKLGWMWVSRDSEESGNYWFYHLQHGWLWSGPEFFVEGNNSISHFYSNSLGRWLYFSSKYGFYDFAVNDGKGAYID